MKSDVPVGDRDFIKRSDFGGLERHLMRTSRPLRRFSVFIYLWSRFLKCGCGAKVVRGKDFGPCLAALEIGVMDPGECMCCIACRSDCLESV